MNEDDENRLFRAYAKKRKLEEKLSIKVLLQRVAEHPDFAKRVPSKSTMDRVFGNVETGNFQDDTQRAIIVALDGSMDAFNAYKQAEMAHPTPREEARFAPNHNKAAGDSTKVEKTANQSNGDSSDFLSKVKTFWDGVTNENGPVQESANRDDSDTDKNAEPPFTPKAPSDVPETNETLQQSAVANLAAKLKDRVAAGTFNSVIKFDTGDGVLVIDNQTVSIEDRKADCTVTIAEKVLEAIIDGDLNLIAAYMQGKLTVDGDMSVLMSFVRVL